MGRFLHSLFLLFALATAACSSGSDPAPPPPPIADYTWENLGPAGGFVSSLAFDPTQQGVVWASGDDSSGIFRSSSGGTAWERVTTTPPDHSTYSLVVDPTDGDRIYAPNYFGRGLLSSLNGGVTWDVLGSGLPATRGLRKVNGHVTDPANAARLFTCTAGGLFVSADFGMTFSSVSAGVFGAETDFTAAAAGPAGVFVGTRGGRVYRTVDSAATWTEVTTGAGSEVTDLALSANALYIARVDGALERTTDFGSAGLVELDPAGGGAFETGLWVRVAVVAGASAATDMIYVGSVATPLSADWGMHVSFDGGASFLERNTGLGGNSVFSLAVDPFDPMHVLMGSVGGGIYQTTDAGLTWVARNAGLFAPAVLALAQDATDPQHLLVSSTEGLNGTPSVFETFDFGSTWSVVTAAPGDALSLEMDPSNPDLILLGGFNGDGITNPGIRRSVAGSGGPWVDALTTQVRIERFVRTSERVFAFAVDFTAPASLADLGLYSSSDNGATWTLAFNQLTTNLAQHPVEPVEAVLVGGDAWATTDSFATTPISLGLLAFAPGRNFTSVAFLSPTSLLVGTDTAELYRTDAYNAAGTGVTWTQVEVPAASVLLRDIHVDDDAWYVGCFTGDFLVQPDSTPGVLRSLDEGQSWTFLDEGMGSSRLVWSLHARTGQDRTFLAAMWGGGMLQLTDPR